ncbi:hypothetical protein [Croceicoccus sp. YJ47]|uniref:hypothetical protein n=1 Tax=Croceicoccus sp. YJ47 TaxID=2798724 RepID=UPI001923C602|nr:hypothetical protein [Croceicoccus sp. YJ47]QQN73966.1 hypothetical protein JD971_14655 [Croceicoccus sp. YJ47]
MIEGWLTTKALFGLSRAGWVGIGIALIGAVWFWLWMAERADDRTNQTLGANKVVIEQQEQTNEVLSDALGADNPDAVRDQRLCDKYNRAGCAPAAR